MSKSANKTNATAIGLALAIKENLVVIAALNAQIDALAKRLQENVKYGRHMNGSRPPPFC